MGLFTNRSIDIDIIANDKASQGFNSVADSAQSFSTRVNNSISSLNRGLKDYNNVMNTMYRSTQIALVGAGYFISRFTKEAISEFAEFERQHGKTMGAIANNYDSSIESQRKFIENQRKLKEESLRLGTVGPGGNGSLYTPTEISYAQTAMAKAGMKDSEISSIIPDIIKFAGGNDITIDQAAEWSINLSKMFDIPIDQLASKLDEITRAADISTIDVPDIFESLRYAGPIAQSLGKSLEEVLSMFVVMGNAGISGSMAGTGIQAFYSRILSPRGMVTASATAPSDYALQMYQSFADSAVDENGKFKSAADVTAMLDDIMNTMTDQEQAWFATKLFGLFQMKAGFTLSKNGGDVLREVEQNIIDNAPGTNDTKWDIMLQTSWGRQEAFRNAMSGLKTDVGYRLSPLTNAIIDELFAVLNNTGNYNIDFSKIDASIEESSELISEKYGQQASDIVRSIMKFGRNSSQIGGAMLPIVPGTLDSLGQLASGDIMGSISTFNSMIDLVNTNIDQLPPELQDMAEQVRNVILALMALTGVNFATRLLENITSLWKMTIGKLITAANMNVTATNVVLYDTGVLDANGKPIYRQGTAVAGKGGTPSTGTAIPVYGADGKVIKTVNANGGGSTIVDSYGRPITSGTQAIKSGANWGSKIAKGANIASWLYAIGEMTGINEKILDKAGINGRAREFVDGTRDTINKTLLAVFADNMVFKGAVRKGIMSGVGSAISEVVGVLGTSGALASGGILVGGSALMIGDRKAIEFANMQEATEKAIADANGMDTVIDWSYYDKSNYPWYDPNGMFRRFGNYFSGDPNDSPAIATVKDAKTLAQELNKSAYEFPYMISDGSQESMAQIAQDEIKFYAYQALNRLETGMMATYQEYKSDPNRWDNSAYNSNSKATFDKLDRAMLSDDIFKNVNIDMSKVQLSPNINIDVNIDRDGNATYTSNSNMNVGMNISETLHRMGGGITPIWQP